MFFVTVASKEFSQAVSLLFATLAGVSISVASKGVMRAKRWRESSVLGWEDFEGVKRTTRRARMGFDKHGKSIAREYQVVKCFSGNGRN